MKNGTVIKLELKYCENCGALWFRRMGDHYLYCNGCRQICSNNAGDQTRDQRYADEMAGDLIQ